MPRELRCTGAGQMVWHEYESPELGPEQVRIRSEFSAAKHGTEMAFYKGYAAHRGRYDREMGLFTMQPPAPAAPAAGRRPGPAGAGVGNMTVGPVIEVGSGVTALAPGDRVLIHGGFRATHVRPAAACWKIPPELSWKSAVCLDPADFAFGAIRDGHVRVGDAVAIFGMGAIGLMGVQIARAAGASPVIAVEPLGHRRELAARVGADLVLDPAACDAGLEIRRATGRRGADVAIEYSGSPQALQAALRGVAYGGNVVAGAFPPPYGAGLDLGAEAHINRPNIIFSRSCSQPDRDHPRWDEGRIIDTCLRLLIDGTLSGDEIVTPVVAFEDAFEAYPKIATEPDTFVKLGVEY